MIINLDMDGVLVKFVPGVFRAFGVEEQPTHHWDDIPRALTDRLGGRVTDDDMWKTIDQLGSVFWSGLEPTKHCFTIVETCRKYGEVMLTTTPGRNVGACVSGKVAWIKKHMPDMLGGLTFATAYDGVHAKGMLGHPRAFLVDDGDHNAAEFTRRGGRAFLWPRLWNVKARNPDDGDVGVLGYRLARAHEAIHGHQRVLE